MTVTAKDNFTAVAVNTLSLLVGLTQPLIFCWNFMSINSSDKVLLAIGISLTTQTVKHLSIKRGFHTTSLSQKL
jgi:hypothetical protein